MNTKNRANKWVIFLKKTLNRKKKGNREKKSFSIRISPFCLIVFLSIAIFLIGGVFAFNNVYANTNGQVELRKKKLKEQLHSVEKEIETKQEVLEEKKKERVSTERDIAILKAKIEKAKLEIRRRNIAIAGLNKDIENKQIKVNTLEDKLSREKKSLGQLLRKINNLDDYSLAEIVLGNENLSDFFSRVDSFKIVNKALETSLREAKKTKKSAQKEKTILQDEKQEKVNLRQVQILQKNKIERQEKEKQNLLSITKSKEREYQNIINKKQKTAAEIKTELFTLRDTRAIPFGDAFELAILAHQKTGVRPAFLLAILAEETNIGEFLGSGSWNSDMHPTRDRPVFKAMAREIGFNLNEVPVSKAPSYGWGGAMGPAQFIPSTWVCYGGFINTQTGDCNNKSRALAWDNFWQGPWNYVKSKDRVRKLVKGDAPSNPWNPEDAFMASALLLTENGADKGGLDAERLAALRYFAGWSNATNPDYAFYGNDVMELARKYQDQIDILNK